MKRMMIVTIVISLLGLICLHGENPNKSPLVSKTFSMDTKKSDTELQKHFEDYIGKYKKLGINVNENIKNDLYYMKINVNKVKELKKAGLDLQKFLENKHITGFWNEYNTKELALLSQIIVYGQIEEVDSLRFVEGINSPLLRMHIKVKDILKGEYLYDQRPNSVILYLYEDYLMGNFHVPIEKGDNVLFFINRFNSDYSEGNYEGWSQRYNINDRRNFDGSCLMNWYVEKEGKFFSDMSYRDNDRGVISHNEGRIDSVMQVIRNIDKINDTKNFYNEDFKTGR